jgi:hypothetical protein
LLNTVMSQPESGRAERSSTFPFTHRTVTIPPLVEIVLVWAWAPELAGGAVVPGVLRVVVVADDVVVDEFFFEFVFPLGGSAGLAVVVVVVDDDGGGSGGAVTVLVVEGAAAALTSDPAAAPGRGSVLAGDAEAGLDVASAEGLAEASSVGGEAGGVAVSGSGPTGRAICSTPAGTDRAAWRARRTSGWDNGATRLVEKRDETSCTPNNPRSTPLTVPRAHVTTRTRRTAKW